MTREQPTHTVAGIELVRRIAAEGDRIFTMDRARELAPAVGLSDAYLRQALHHLTRSGWLVRLRKGLYAVSSAIPGVAPVHEFEIAMALARPSAISHWSAMQYHGLTEQIPRRVFVLTPVDVAVPRFRGHQDVGAADGFSVAGTIYQFVQTKREWFFGAEQVWIGEARIAITDPERTLLDGLSRPQYCGDFSESLHAFDVRGGRLDLPRIIDYALKLDVATAKRLGWVLEESGVPAGRLGALADLPIVGYRNLDPSGPRGGPYNRRWMLRVNLPGRTGL
ncbi:MAG: type IV toxin-antitoxin system AbiEi family antitoxin domain-containing protein [Thermoleophilia bacterium]